MSDLVCDNNIWGKVQHFHSFNIKNAVIECYIVGGRWLCLILYKQIEIGQHLHTFSTVQIGNTFNHL